MQLNDRAHQHEANLGLVICVNRVAACDGDEREGISHSLDCNHRWGARPITREQSRRVDLKAWHPSALDPHFAHTTMRRLHALLVGVYEQVRRFTFLSQPRRGVS